MWCETDRLMERHYDADLTVFAAFLDRRYMAYSVAYYGEDPGAIRTSRTSLEGAQMSEARPDHRTGRATGGRTDSGHWLRLWTAGDLPGQEVSRG